MRIITVTSDNYIENTQLLIESIRCWHPHVPIDVYALNTGWTHGHTQHFQDPNVTLKIIQEKNAHDRTAWSGGGIHNSYKLDVFLMYTQPFLFLDSDILVLRPLDEIFRLIQTNGWLSCHDGIRLHEYANGPISKYVTIPHEHAHQCGFNTGVMGCDPTTNQDVLLQARTWVDLINENFQGDQGLMNLAWWVKRGCIPPNADNRYNGGWREDNRLELHNTILHFARKNYGGPQKLIDQRRIWHAWPKQFKMIDLVDTPFWKASKPHPWHWLNQSSQKCHRHFVKQMRNASRELLNIPQDTGLLIENADQAFLLAEDVLHRHHQFWKTQASCFKNVPYRPVYGLNEYGQIPNPISLKIQHLKRWLSI